MAYTSGMRRCLFILLTLLIAGAPLIAVSTELQEPEEKPEEKQRIRILKIAGWVTVVVLVIVVAVVVAPYLAYMIWVLLHRYSE